MPRNRMGEWRHGSITVRLGTRWRWVVSFTQRGKTPTFFGGGNETESTIWPIVLAPDGGWRWVSSNRWIDWQGKLKYSEKICPVAALSTTNPGPRRWEAGDYTPELRHDVSSHGYPTDRRIGWGPKAGLESVYIHVYTHCIYNNNNNNLITQWL
jgi:hypothetical protein